MPAGTFAQNAMLAYLLLGSTGTPVTTCTIGMSLGSPSQASLSEIGAGSGYTRKVGSGWNSLASNTYGNQGLLNFSTALSTSATISGCFVVDQNGNLLLYGTLSPATLWSAGSTARFGSNGLKVTIT